MTSFRAEHGLLHPQCLKHSLLIGAALIDEKKMPHLVSTYEEIHGSDLQTPNPSDMCDIYQRTCVIGNVPNKFVKATRESKTTKFLLS